MAEIVNIGMLATRTDVEICITFFVAFHILVNIDNLYAESLDYFPLKRCVSSPLRFETSPQKQSWSSRTPSMKVLRIYIIVVELLYNSIYYYFMPFLVMWIPYI